MHGLSAKQKALGVKTGGLYLNESIPSLIPLGSAATRYELVALRARRSAFNRSKLARKASSACLRSRIACSASRRRFSAFSARCSAEVGGFSRASNGCMRINAPGQPKFPDAASLLRFYDLPHMRRFEPVGLPAFARHARTALTAHLCAPCALRVVHAKKCPDIRFGGCDRRPPWRRWGAPHPSRPFYFFVTSSLASKSRLRAYIKVE
jgi:hypothetical protein